MSNAKLRIGRAQARRVQERPPEAPFGRRLSNKDTLKLSKAAARNLIAGTIEKNKAKADKKAGATRRDNKVTRLELDRIGTNEDGDSIIQMKKK